MDELANPEHPLWGFLPEMTNEFWAAIVGAIVGSVVGGLIAFGIQRMSLNAAKDERAEEAERQRRALGYSLLFRMVRIYSNLAIMHRHIEGYFTFAAEKGLETWEPWQVVKPIANPLDKVHFDNQEMALLLSFKDNDLFNDMASLDLVHNTSIELLRTYKAERGALLEKLPARMHDMVGRIELPKEHALYVRPKMAELNDLVTQTRETFKRDADQAADVLGRLTSLLNDKLKLGVSIEDK